MKYSEQLTQLLTQGEVPLDNPLDYTGLGFSMEHADELIRMATDAELLNSDADSLEFWAVIHAWYALAQLKVAAAVEPMLDLIDASKYDLLFDQEYPKVFALMGEVAIPELKNYLYDENREELVRAHALHSLDTLGKTYRQACLDILCELLQKLDKNSKELAGMVISSLMDLKATEAIETIRDAFNRDCVNISIPGDLEDVEIDLGLRNKRDTSRPNYNQFSPDLPERLMGLLGSLDPETKSVAKVGRNDPCPCGSGKKYKKCCLH